MELQGQHYDGARGDSFGQLRDPELVGQVAKGIGDVKPLSVQGDLRGSDLHHLDVDDEVAGVLRHLDVDGYTSSVVGAWKNEYRDHFSMEGWLSRYRDSHYKDKTA